MSRIEPIDHRRAYVRVFERFVPVTGRREIILPAP